MLNKSLIATIICLSLASHSAVAAEKDPYAICSIGGFFRGTSNKFMSGITTHIITRKKIFNNPTCIRLHNESFQLGRKLVAGDNINDPAELDVINMANDFRDNVYKTISTQMGY